MSGKMYSDALKDKCVLVTRANHQADSFQKGLESKGAIPYLFPLIQTQRTRALDPLDEAIQALAKYRWLVFTSVNGVNFFARRCQELYPAASFASLVAHAQIAAVGPKTKLRLEEYGLPVTLMPSDAKQEELAEELCQWVKPNERVLIPTSQLARPLLRETLQQHSILVDVVEVYETLAVEHSSSDKEKLLQKLQASEIDVLTFTSPSTVVHFLRMMEEMQAPWQELLSTAVVACIGPITAQKAEECGMKVEVQAQPYTVEALMANLEEYFRNKSTGKQV